MYISHYTMNYLLRGHHRSTPPPAGRLCLHFSNIVCRIAGSVSEDSGSCTSPRDVSPAGKLRRRRRRERRLPTFIKLSNGSTPSTEGHGLTTDASPAAAQRSGEFFGGRLARVCAGRSRHKPR